MKKTQYHEYLRSVKWLLKKNELISIYLSQGWSVNCFICGSTNSLQVHHKDYKEVGNEDLSEQASKEGRGIYQLEFLCANCHRKNHFEVGWREKQDAHISKEVTDWIASGEFEKSYG